MINPLKQLLLDHVPSKMFEGLLARQPIVYSEARHMAFDTTLWEQPEAESVFPIHRRAIFEGELRRICRAIGMTFENCSHHGDNYWYVLAHAGTLRLTVHHVDHPKRFVRPCSSRKQNASINTLLLQPCLEEALLEPLPKIEGLVNAHILHGLIRERVGDQILTRPFMTIGFPHPSANTYVDAWDILDVLQMYAEHSATNIVELGTDTVVLPEIRLKPDAGEIDEKEKVAKDKKDNKKKLLKA